MDLVRQQLPDLPPDNVVGEPIRRDTSAAVALAALDFLTSDAPKRRYMVVPNEQEANATIGAHIRRLVQLNQDQPYEFTRDELAARGLLE